MDLLAGLNPVQRQAVRHRGCPMLLLAGAGSGKTRVVTHRIAGLLQEGVPAWRILAVTFTNRAAQEMRERIHTLLGVERLPELIISTFHALGARLLRRHAAYFGRQQSFVIYDDKDQLELLRQIVAEKNLPLEASEVKQLRWAIDRAKNAGLDASAMAPPTDLPLLDWAAVGRAYEARLELANAFDFGDLVLRPAQLLFEQPQLAASYRDRWRYLHVDEFQDTNVAQFRLLQQLALSDSELFAVGDDDQSIYGWRGAEVENILKFSDLYPGAQVLRLEQNYRSDGRILEAANQVIAHNKARLGKTLWTERGGGAEIEYFAAGDGREEARWIARRIRRLCIEEGYTPSSIAILFRANYLSLDLEQALQLESMPYALVKGRSFYERAEVRDALAWVRIAHNPADEVAFLRAAARPARGVGKVSLAKLQRFAQERQLSLYDAIPPALAEGLVKGRARTGLDALWQTIEAARQPTQAALTDQVKQLWESAGLWAELEATSLVDEHARAQRENVERLLDALGQYLQEAPSPSLSDWLEQVKLVSELDMAPLGGGRVSMLTVHAAKGLEFPVVFMMGMEEGLFPHYNSQSSFDWAERLRGLEEERRLFYVAITRAQKRLMLSCAGERFSRGRVQAATPSQFLKEMPEDFVERLSVGAVMRRPAGGLAFGQSSLGFGGAAGPRASARPASGRGGGGFAAGKATQVRAEDGEVFSVGQKVYHSQFGVGQVVAAHPGARPSVTVSFEGIGQRKIITRFLSAYGG